jgi:hypothetical protein
LGEDAGFFEVVDGDTNNGFVGDPVKVALDLRLWGRREWG